MYLGTTATEQTITVLLALIATTLVIRAVLRHQDPSWQSDYVDVRPATPPPTAATPTPARVARVTSFPKTTPPGTRKLRRQLVA